MNKKLLFATMSLAVLAACTNDDFESQKVAKEVSPVQFELINDDAATRATWSETGKMVSFSAIDGDLFTLYHGGALSSKKVSTLENAIYTAQSGSPATLTTPSMIKAGKAVMVWPVDTAFTIKPADKFSISIPAEQTDYVNQIPYVSDLIGITDEADWTKPTAAYNKAGYQRKYPIFMRQMGSLLTLMADYAGTDAKLAELEAGEDGIDPIELTGVTLSTNAAGSTLFTKTIPVTFEDANTNWPAAATLNHAWVNVTSFDAASIAAEGQTATLSAKDKSLLAGNQGAKIILLPHKTTTDIADAAVIVETIYGKVVVAANGVATSKYSDAEYKDAWSRYLTDPATMTSDEAVTTVKDADGKTKVTSNIVKGMTQTINWFSSADRKSTNATIKDEPVGGLLTRYVKVLLTHLDMSDLHIKSDKQLRDAARVWKKMNLDAVTVYLDGDANGEFSISQKTIEAINAINAAAAEEETPRAFNVKPCTETGEACSTIVITGGGDVPENLDFILKNGTTTADVALNEGESWKWVGTVTVDATNNGIAGFINRGTMTNAETATLAIYDNETTAVQQNIELENEGIWNVTAGDLTVQFDVTNYGTVNIKKNAEYHQDVYGTTPTKTTFTNEANTLPERFVLNDPSISADDKAAFEEEIGLVNNAGVFAVTGVGTTKGVINNYGLIEHGVYPGDEYNKDAKTYITANQTLSTDGFTADAVYTSAFNKATSGDGNKLGRINLPYSNKDEDNISISADLASGFVSVTVATGNGAPSDGKLNAGTVGDKVNYVIINSGVTTITEMSAKIQYIEFNDDANTEIAWQAGTSGSPKTATYEGLIVLSPVNIKLFTKVVVNSGTYLGAKMYVGGGFTNTGSYSAYYGNTAANEATMYITYK